jgi:hypothetical protein
LSDRRGRKRTVQLLGAKSPRLSIRRRRPLPPLRSLPPLSQRLPARPMPMTMPAGLWLELMRRPWAVPLALHPSAVHMGKLERLLALCLVGILVPPPSTTQVRLPALALAPRLRQARQAMTLLWADTADMGMQAARRATEQSASSPRPNAPSVHFSSRERPAISPLWFRLLNSPPVLGVLDAPPRLTLATLVTLVTIPATTTTLRDAKPSSAAMLMSFVPYPEIIAWSSTAPAPAPARVPPGTSLRPEISPGPLLSRAVAGTDPAQPAAPCSRDTDALLPGCSATIRRSPAS